MVLRTFFCALVLLALSGCVTEESGKVDPTQTEQGRKAAVDAYIRLGLAYFREGMGARAKLPLGKALELDPNSADAHAALAIVFQSEMELALADKHYREALKNDGQNARILNNYGSFLYDRERYKEAQALFLQAAQDPMYSERARVFENLGLVSLRLNQPVEARDYFNRALHLDRRRPIAFLELAFIAYDAKDFAATQYCYDNFLALMGTQQQSARSLLLGARLARHFQNPAKLKERGEQLKRLYPASPEYKTYLSEQR